MLNLLDVIPWNEYRNFLASGDPPVILRLVFLNTVFLMIFVVRRARGASNLRPQTGIALQILLLFANFAIVTSADLAGI